MRRQLLAAFAVALALAPLGVRPAQAQPWVYQQPVYGRGYRPMLSPYLNLLRNNGDPAINYYLGTLPETQRRENAFQFRTEISDIEAKLPGAAEEKPDDVPKGLGPTGGSVAFGNTKGYINSTGNFFPPISLPPGVAKKTVSGTR